MRRSPLAPVLFLLAFVGVAQADVQVVSSSPARNEVAAAGAAVAIVFDVPLDTATVTAASFRVWGRWTGPMGGAIAFSNGDRTATLTPNRPFSAGDTIFVNLANTIRAADASPLRSAGWATQFRIATLPSSGIFQEVQSFSNTTGGAHTQIYGASAADLNNDRYLDLATINETSADVRVFLNRADGTATYGPMLPRQAIGVESSPNEPADFNHDGNVDLCVSAADSQSVWILLGDGHGAFSSVQEIPVGGEPHGIAALDVDGDGDLDVVDANVGSDQLALLINNGAGVFSAPTYFEGGVSGEYGLVASDMNGDGISDLVVGGRNGSQINTMLGNGNATFTAAGPAQASGGNTWVIALGDVDGDHELDVAAANDGSGNVGVLIGNGDGSFDPPSTISVGSHLPSVDLGDLDGDGDLDMVISSYGGGFWRWLRNDGTGAFTTVADFGAVSNPSCAVLLDADNDGDLDMALFDEVADVVKIRQNAAASSCPSAPAVCRTPVQGKKSRLVLRDKTNDKSDSLSWSWSKGPATPRADFGDPLTSEGYELCLYEDGALAESFPMPAGGLCAGRPCWKSGNTGFAYADRLGTPKGITSARLTEGLVEGRARVTVMGRGSALDLPDLTQLDGVLEVQLRNDDSICWGAVFSPPFQKHLPDNLTAVSDTPPLFRAIHAETIKRTCGGCHGTSAGLGPLTTCSVAHAQLVNMTSTENPTLHRVEPGDPVLSWFMHKLDGTQGGFTAQCQGGFCGSQMPLGGTPLSLGTRNAIRNWITNGAVNDCPP